MIRINFYLLLILGFTFVLISCAAGDPDKISQSNSRNNLNDPNGGNYSSVSSVTSFSSSSTGGTVSPTVISASPQNNDQGVWISQTINITFSKTMNKNLTTNAFSLKDPGNFNIAGTFQWVNNDQNLGFTPSGTLSYDKEYTMTIGTGAEDISGNPLPAAFTSKFTTGWAQATTNGGWPGRTLSTCVSFKNSLWLLGGFSTTISNNDVWCSSDGADWNQAIEVAPWIGRHWHTSVVFDNKIWVMGGCCINGDWTNDVCYSPDGTNWYQATAAAGWSGREGHTSVVYDGGMWVIGGLDTTGHYKSDVWNSADGTNWFQISPSAGWSVRYDHASVVFNNAIWVMGGCDGNYMNDVWYSTDGVNWSQVTASAPWSKRSGFSAVVAGQKIWIMGGNNSTTGYQTDVWYSSDGTNWMQAMASTGWGGREWQVCTVDKMFVSIIQSIDRIWLIGGYQDGQGKKSDAWWILP